MKETATQARIPHPTTKNARRKSHVNEKDNPISHGTTRSITKKVGTKWGQVRDKLMENHYTVAELILHKSIYITHS